jgi:hypothetical protein
MAITTSLDQNKDVYKAPNWCLIDGQVSKISSVVVHTIRMGDVEDPDLWVAEPMWQWQQSEAGSWAMEHSKDKLMWQRTVDYQSFGYIYYIVARFEEKDLTFWKLKYE